MSCVTSPLLGRSFSRFRLRPNCRIQNNAHLSRVSPSPLKARGASREPSPDLDPPFPRLPFLSLSFAALSASPLLSPSISENDPLSFAKAVGLLTLIVAVHECGHFLAARLQNIHVSKFAIGFGPVLARYQSREMEYSIRAIPLGGFVAFPDDDPNSPFPEDDPDLLRNRPVLDRAIVISAGVVANFIFAFVILLMQVSSVGITTEVFEKGVIIPQVVAGSAAEKAGNCELV